MSGSSSRRRVWIALGSIFIVGGLVAAVVLWNAGTQRQNSTIEKFARAPIGCDTTLDFIESGEYLLFVETVGTIDDVRGDCSVDGAYDSADGDPDVDITLVDPDGNEVDLDRSFGDVDYNADGFEGSARFSVQIDETDDHVLRAESDAGDVFVVAVGRDPSDGVAALRIGAIGAGIVGVLAGLALILLGKRTSATTAAAGPWTLATPAPPGTFVAGGAPPQGPPVYGQHGGPPQYAQQPPAPQPYGQPGVPGYGHPHQYSQQQPYGQQPYSQQPPAPQAASPQYPPVQPNIAGQPTFPQAPADPAASDQPIEWAPQERPAPAPSSRPASAFRPDAQSAEQPRVPSTDASETASPEADFVAELRDEEVTRERPHQERRSPPPPE